MQEGVRPRKPASAPEPSSVDDIVRELTREQAAAAELATGLREIIRDNPIVHNAKRISKAVDTLQVLAAVLGHDDEIGGTGGAKKALQDHLNQLKTLSGRCSSLVDFAHEAELHAEAFRLCKQLESTPRRLADAMNLHFEVLVDLNSSAAQSSAPHKRALLAVLRNLGDAYGEIAAVLHVPELEVKNPDGIRGRIWKWYFRIFVGAWLLTGLWMLVTGSGIFRTGFLLVFSGSAALVLSILLVHLAMPFIEQFAQRSHRKKLEALGVLPDKKGRYRILPNGLLAATDYGVLKSLLRARGHEWEEFEQP